MINVKDILEKKGRAFWSVTPENTVFEALELMAEHNIGSVLVMENSKLVGIFSERDYARKIILQGYNSRSAHVGNFMTCQILTVTPDSNINECMAIMTEKKIRHLPVLENDTVVGLISIGDVVNAVIQSQDYTIKHLESYIYGGR
jgi:CBS domain-containing protein